MAERERYLTDADVRYQKRINNRVRGGKGSQLPRARRRRGGVSASPIRVYEFQSCSDNLRKLYLDNAEISKHLPGGEEEETSVAIILLDGVLECWQLVGTADHCKTGQCAEILTWVADCEACAGGCVILNPCDSGSIVVVRGIDWFRYVGKTILIDAAGTGAACYFVTEAANCDGVNETLTVDDIQAVYASCSACGCYELTHCDTSATQLVSDDLAGLFGRLPAAVVGLILELDDGCWEVTAFETPCSTANPLNLGISGSTPTYETCEDCGCYLISPCSGNSGTAYKVKPGPSDTIDLREFVNADGTSNGKAFMDGSYACWTVSRSEDGCEGATSGIGTVEETFDDCTSCGVTCWERCDSPGTYIRTKSDLGEYTRSGVALKRAEDGFCYQYEESLGACGTPAIVAFTPEDVYEHATDACTICMDPRYKLTPCTDGGCGGSDCGGSGSAGNTAGSEIVTDQEEFNDAVGQIVKVEGRCYEVSLTTDTVTRSDLSWCGPFASCAECDAAASRLTVIAKIDGEYKAVTIEGSFKMCGDAATTEPCTEA